jgi:hypothetical protein
MKFSEIRTELLDQHANLRSLLASARDATARWTRGTGTRSDATESIVRLLDALAAHNVREEELLERALPQIDAWGAVRAEVLGEEHVGEHRALYATLVAALSVETPSELEGVVRGFGSRVLEHMAREESTFLGEDALRDDATSIDAFSG